MKLTYRDKVILAIFLAALILIAGFVALIKPKRAAIADNKDKLTVVEDEKTQIENRIATIKPLQDDIEEVHKKAEDRGKIFVTKTDIDQTTLLDKFMQEFANKCEVRITELRVDDIAAGALSYYYKPYSEVATALRESADINGSLLDQVNAEREESDLIAGRAVETVMSTRYGISITGTKENVWKYLDEIYNYDEAVIVSAFGFERSAKNDEENQQGQQPAAAAANQAQNDEKKAQKIDMDTIIDADLVIQLYSIYNMPKPDVE